MHIQLDEHKSFDLNMVRVGQEGRSVSLDKFQSAIALEYEERKPDKDAPQGYGPSAAFNSVASEIGGYASSQRMELDRRAEDGEAFSEKDVATLRALEVLSAQSLHGPESRIAKMVAEGKMPNQASTKHFKQLAAKEKRDTRLSQPITVPSATLQKPTDVLMGSIDTRGPPPTAKSPAMEHTIQFGLH